MAGEDLKTLVLAQDGDLVLIVGDSDKQMGIKVNSALLRAASKVFNAMLGPQFAEGQYFDKSNLKDVPLPEDDPGAMAALCSIIHYRNDLLEELPEARKIFFMAVLADRYDCTTLLRQTSQYWFTFSPTVVYDWACMIAAAYVLNNEQGFQKFAEKLVLEYDLPYGNLHHQTVAICESTPWKLWCKGDIKTAT
ncbi:MAG: hypothetical protein M1820_009067 [Bogoriella megaspora]|nr:MAG: hypothetical protein M1820_009067 [Bogoriella megaspora]